MWEAFTLVCVSLNRTFILSFQRTTPVVSCSVTHTRFVIVRSVRTRALLNHSFMGSSLSENHSGGISLNNHTRVVLLPENDHTMLRLNNTTGWTLEHFVLALHSLLWHQNPLMRLLLCFQFILKRLISLQMLRSLFF